MNLKFKEVPTDILTGKDLDYLSDMFKWNYEAYKNTCNSIENVEDEDVKVLLEKASTLFDNNMEEVLNILNEGGNCCE